jgi:hypothetical protein
VLLNKVAEKPNTYSYLVEPIEDFNVCCGCQGLASLQCFDAALNATLQICKGIVAFLACRRDKAGPGVSDWLLTSPEILAKCNHAIGITG